MGLNDRIDFLLLDMTVFCCWLCTLPLNMSLHESKEQRISCWLQCWINLWVHGHSLYNPLNQRAFYVAWHCEQVTHLWQSWVEIKHYSVAYIFQPCYCDQIVVAQNIVKSRAHMHYVHLSGIHVPTLHVWALPLTEVLHYSLKCGNVVEIRNIRFLATFILFVTSYILRSHHAIKLCNGVCADIWQLSN